MCKLVEGTPEMEVCRAQQSSPPKKYIIIRISKDNHEKSLEMNQRAK